MPLYPVQNDYFDPFKIPPANRVDNPGALTLYRSSTGFERALADSEAERLMDTYAEAIVDQWNPWQVANEHLPFLAWAQGVNLWEHWWDETFRRNWVARQWYLKSIRGKRAGLDEFVAAVGGSVKRCIVPPARAYGTKALTDEERAAYVARFPQLRIYPYVAREQLPWLCYCGVHYDGLGLNRRWNKNGSFLGPLRPVYPTVQNAGGKYTRTAVYYDPRTGVETKLTVRRIVKILTGENAGWGFTPGVSQYDESVVLPLEHRPAYFIRESQKYLGFNIHLGKALPLRTISIGRSGYLDLVQGKAQYQTIFPQEELLNIRPEYVAIPHPRRKTEVYAARGEYLVKARSIVTHAVASNLVTDPPVFGRALFGMHANPFVISAPTFGAPVLAPAGPLDAETLTWVTNVQAIGGSVSAGRRNLVNNLIVGLKTDGVWTRLDRLWLLAAENQQSARVDLRVGITPATTVGSPTFTADRGFQTVGTTAYLNTGYVPGVGVGNYTTDNAHLGDWIETATTANSAVLFGALGSKNSFLGTTAGGNYGAFINDNSAVLLDSLIAKTNVGFLLGSRSASNVLALYFNGASVASGSQVSAAPFLPASFIGCRNNNGSPDAAAAHRSAAISIGVALNATEHLALYNRLRTYMTAVGVP